MRYKGKKGRAWEVVRKYICERDGYRCITCHRSKASGHQMQAGHYQPVGLVGSNNTLSWDERNIACQCATCNGVGQGMQVRMREALVRRYGARAVKALDARVGKIDPIKDWDSIIQTYERKKHIP